MRRLARRVQPGADPPDAVADAAGPVAERHFASDGPSPFPKAFEVALAFELQPSEGVGKAKPRMAIAVDHDVALIGVADMDARLHC